MSEPLHGLVVNFRHAMPSRSQILELNPKAIRSIIYSDDDLDQALSIIPATIPVIVLLSSEHEELGPSYTGWPEYIQRFASKYAGRVWAVEIENEADIKGIPTATIASLCYHCEPLKYAGILRIVSSVAGEYWQEYLASLNAFLTRQHIDGCAFHPYGQRVDGLGDPQPGYGPGIEDSIRRASQLMGGMPCYVTEFGAKLSDYGGEGRQAQYVTEAFYEIDYLQRSVCPVACFFAWHDGVGAPGEQGADAFGLMRADGTKRPAWDTYVALHPSTPVFALGFKEIADRHPVLIGSPLEMETYPHPGLSHQWTTKGLLWWGDTVLGGNGMGFTANDRTRYLWDGTQLRKVA